MPFAGLTDSHYLRKHVLDGSRSDKSIITARGDKTAMRLFAKLLWTLVIIIIITGPPAYSVTGPN